MSIRTDIEAYTGYLGNRSLTEQVRRSIARVVDLIPRGILSPSVSLLGGIGSGKSTLWMKVLSVGNNARQVAETESYRYMDPASIYYVSNVRDAIYWLSNNMVYSYPDDADCEVIDYSSVDEYDPYVECLPPQFTEAVVIDVALGILQGRLVLDMHAPFSLNIKTETALSAFSDYGYGGLYEELYGGKSTASSLELPTRLGTLILEWNDVSFLTDQWNAEIKAQVEAAQTELSEINLAIISELGKGLAPQGTEDLELAVAHIQHLDSRIKAYVQNVDVLLKKILSDSEIEKTNRFKQFELTIERSRNELAKFSQSLALFSAHGQLLIAEHKENLERQSVAIGAIQMLQTRFVSIFTPFQMEKKS